MYSSFKVDIKYIAIKVIAIMLTRLFKNFDIRNIKNIPIWNSSLKNIIYYHIIIIYSKSYMIYRVPGTL